MSDLIKPFRINVPQTELDELQQRLALTRWTTEQTEESPWQQGVPLERAKALVDYWQTQYSWRRCEEALNRFDNFVYTADDVDIHFIHVRSRHTSARPLLLTHGWPGSILEFTDIIDRLINPQDHGGSAEDAFHLVIPSLPGFGFSGKPATAGWNVEKIARTWGDIMLALGYQAYVAQGGDWGSAVTLSMASQKLEGLQGIHLNLVIAMPNPGEELTPEEQAALIPAMQYIKDGNGYAVIQTTRPQTIGYSLSDSPVGLATWIYEKFQNWSDCGGDPESIFSKDRLLDNISLYWLTNSGHSSARLYWESFNKSFAGVTTDLPVGVTVYPKDVSTPCEKWVARLYPNLIYFNSPTEGGHFPAMEQPQGFVEELRKTFAKLKLG
ncbi:epoxide hydrolase [Maricurvus nonylphenolicus]|uniref:epoxide hydrolase family protein n=1 Tax=Maricurvus nonylphenolicus TaxID=1008307 RepID=UPI0036F2391D